jgi:hypothetical protein
MIILNCNICRRPKNDHEDMDHNFELKAGVASYERHHGDAIHCAMCGEMCAFALVMVAPCPGGGTVTTRVPLCVEKCWEEVGDIFRRADRYEVTP